MSEAKKIDGKLLRCGKCNDPYALMFDKEGSVYLICARCKTFVQKIDSLKFNPDYAKVLRDDIKELKNK